MHICVPPKLSSNLRSPAPPPPKRRLSAGGCVAHTFKVSRRPFAQLETRMKPHVSLQRVCTPGAKAVAAPMMFGRGGAKSFDLVVNRSRGV